MPSDRIVLILWTEHFDEMAATAFITTLRKHGVRAKLVGAARSRLVGASGLALVPDVTLEQALTLAHTAIAVIVPGSVGSIRRLSNDPRVQDLLIRAQVNHATFITSESAVSELADLMEFECPNSIFKSYPADPADVGCIYHLAEELASTTGGACSANS